MVNSLFKGACDWVMCGWDVWDEWRMLVGLFLCLVEVWKSFGKVWLGENRRRKMQGLLCCD